MQDADFPVIQGTVIAAAFLVAVASLVVDVALAWLDPRIREQLARPNAAAGADAGRGVLSECSAGSKRDARRRNRNVQSGHSVGLRPVSSRYQLEQPVVHTVRCMRASSSRL